MNQDLKRTLWAAADKLRSSMDAAEYKHIVLGLMFLKYISDAFDERREALRVAVDDEISEFQLRDAADHPRGWPRMTTTGWPTRFGLQPTRAGNTLARRQGTQKA